MEKKKYQRLTEKHTPKENGLYHALLAFVTGGFMGMLGQFLIDFYASWLHLPTSEATPYMSITLIFIGCLLTCLGFFDKWVNFVQAGLIVPITGFAHATMSAALEYRKEGLVTGIGANMLKLSGSVIIFGVVSAYVFGLVRLILFGG